MYVLIIVIHYNTLYTNYTHIYVELWHAKVVETLVQVIIIYIIHIYYMLKLLKFCCCLFLSIPLIIISWIGKVGRLEKSFYYYIYVNTICTMYVHNITYSGKSLKLELVCWKTKQYRYERPYIYLISQFLYYQILKFNFF